jgi:DNA-binding MarR family transcriptional regulator
MPKKNKKQLPDDLFLTNVQDPDAGVTLWTLSAERSPAMLLSFAANQLIEAASKHFKDNFDLGTVDWRLLFTFAREPGCTAAVASKIIGIDKGAVSRSLKRLETEGLVTAGELLSNGRSRGWTLSKQGRRMHQRILQVALTRQKDQLQGFDVQEVEAFCGYLQRFLRNLEAMNAMR